MDRWIGLEEAVAVADAGSFVAGSKALGVSTSHISRAIAQLEARLDTLLFSRSTRRMALTETGRFLVEHARRIIQERDETLSLIDGDGEPQGTLLMTCSIALGEMFVAPIAQQIAIDYPRLNIRVDLSNRIVDLVGEGYDLAVRSGSVSDARLVARRLGGRKFITCAAPSYLKQRGGPRKIEDLGQHDCLVGTNSSWRFRDEVGERQVTPGPRWQCNNGAAIAKAASAGLGICQLPAVYVREMIADGRLVPILRDFEPDDEPVWLAHPQRRNFLPKVRVMADALLAQFSDAFA